MNPPQKTMGSSDADLYELLDRFAEAWNRHDLDALMSMMTDDCVFEASAGPQVGGERNEGKQAVSAAYAAVFEAFHDARWANPKHFIAGNRGVSEWTFTGTQKDGKRIEVTGCDLFTFRDGRIAVKNSYRKNRPAISQDPTPRDLDQQRTNAIIRPVDTQLDHVLRALREDAEAGRNLHIELTDDYLELIAQVEALPQNQTGADKSHVWPAQRAYVDSFENVRLAPLKE